MYVHVQGSVASDDVRIVAIGYLQNTPTELAMDLLLYTKSKELFILLIVPKQTSLLIVSFNIFFSIVTSQLDAFKLTKHSLIKRLLDSSPHPPATLLRVTKSCYRVIVLVVSKKL